MTTRVCNKIKELQWDCGSWIYTTVLVDQVQSFINTVWRVLWSWSNCLHKELLFPWITVLLTAALTSATNISPSSETWNTCIRFRVWSVTAEDVFTTNLWPNDSQGGFQLIYSKKVTCVTKWTVWFLTHKGVLCPLFHVIKQGKNISIVVWVCTLSCTWGEQWEEEQEVSRRIWHCKFCRTTCSVWICLWFSSTVATVTLWPMYRFCSEVHSCQQVLWGQSLWDTQCQTELFPWLVAVKEKRKEGAVGLLY